MSFYQHIAPYYEEIFPLNPAQAEFVKSAIKQKKDLALLDIGCGTGLLSVELAKYFQRVTAIDLDVAMLEKAIEKADGRVTFQKLNMLEIEKKYGQNVFDSVICFGNTLVHLDGPVEILNFFKQVKSVLTKNGIFLFQVINYDRIIDQGIKGLPTIENDKIKFLRNYYYDQKQNKINFETILTLKKSGETIENTISLYPIRKKEITNMMRLAGFKELSFFGSFKRDDFKDDSQPLIAEAISF